MSYMWSEQLCEFVCVCVCVCVEGGERYIIDDGRERSETDQVHDLGYLG